MAAASSSAAEARLRPVTSNPTGGGLRGAVARADGAAPVRPAASPSRSLCAALRAITSAPAESDRWGPRCAHRAAAIASTAARTRQSLTLGAARRVGVALASLGPRLGSLRLRFGRLGRVRLARRSRCPRARLDKPGVALRAVTNSGSCEPPRTAAVDAREQRGSLRVAVRRPLRCGAPGPAPRSTPFASLSARR